MNGTQHLDRRTILRTLMATTALALSGAAWAQEAPAMPPDVRPGEGRAVLITGASSGFGQRLTELLSVNGWFVCAGARSPEDLARLDAMDNVEAVRLDVTVQADVDAAVAQVIAGGRGLYGLVNNAGVAVMMPVALMDQDEFDYVMGVNVGGPWRMTRAFAPLIIESKGRIVNISSISGIFSALGLGLDSMSKNALEAFNDALAQEMAPYGVRIVAIEPGNFDTHIGATAKARMEARGQSFAGLPCEDRLQATLSRLVEPEGKEGPDRVALTMALALGSPDPLPRYLVVSNPRSATISLTLSLRTVAELNAGQAFRFDLPALTQMLADQVAAARTGE
ncbi:SDR family NAD(P)-dependent oxidoreductase [Cereibacter sphaeroides]|uniref:SDR family NAD(P)-dependent oxidoreductase n=1 Tax=Cereibacter sphaeroides TaxID=1063 RepID=UPI001F27E589|nr:SDR family NAD(P)-dependent oxidoreductase [Cereibacter sphaeroides]MCE6967434.1 SDR family NAD(P)-dependent oxidoreductase [Cereibacter sphaeroides]